MSAGDWISLGGVVAASVAVVVAYLAMIRQGRQTHASNSVDNMWRFVDNWEDEQMHETRFRACQSLKSRGDGDDIPDLLNFFETLGFLVHRRSLDASTAWAMFSEWALPYWKAAQYYIEADQRRDPTYWEEFGYLYSTLLVIEAKKRRKPVSDVEPTDADVSELFKGELSLGPPATPGTAGTDALQMVSGRTFSPWGRKRPRAAVSPESRNTTRPGS